MGYSCRIKKKKPKLTEKHKKVRLEWAKAHESWTSDEWRKVIWSDESKFNLMNSDGKNIFGQFDHQKSQMMQLVLLQSLEVVILGPVNCRPIVTIN